MKQFTVATFVFAGAMSCVARADSIVKTADFSAELRGTWHEQACGSDVCYVDDARLLTAHFTVKKIAKNLHWKELRRLTEGSAKARRSELVAGRPASTVTAGHEFQTVKDYRQTFCFQATDDGISTRTFFCALAGGDVVLSYELSGPLSQSADEFEDAGQRILWTIAPGGLRR